MSVVTDRDIQIYLSAFQDALEIVKTHQTGKRSRQTEAMSKELTMLQLQFEQIKKRGLHA